MLVVQLELMAETLGMNSSPNKEHSEGKRRKKKSQEVKEKEFLKGSEVPESVSGTAHREENFHRKWPGFLGFPDHSSHRACYFLLIAESRCQEPSV